MEKEECKAVFKRMGVCVVIPTYNNALTVAEVARQVQLCCEDVIVVNDGSTDPTAEALASLQDSITTISYQPNKGKGKALSEGFRHAAEHGFHYALTMDADGQHLASDLTLFAEAVTSHPDTLIVGSRRFDHPNMPAKNSFANRFSNFWFTVQTGQRLDDTQTGFRLYPLDLLKKIKPLTSRYEAELELLVRSVWRGIPIFSIPINVHYQPANERVSHFRPTTDFIRISLLNSVLTITALVYGYPAILFHHLAKKNKK